MSLLGITLGTLYQKRFGGPIDWRTGNLMQFLPCLVLFAAAAFAFETRHVVWSGQFIFSLFWLVVVLSILTVALMYWLIRRIPASRVASLFYLVPATDGGDGVAVVRRDGWMRSRLPASCCARRRCSS